MKCPNCGKEIANDSKFCEFCGSQIKIKEDKKLKWGQLIIGAIFMIIGIWGLHNVNRNDSQERDTISAGSTVYYGTYIGNQYIYEGMIDAIRSNYDWNTSKFNLHEYSDYQVTNVYYNNNEILLQICPYAFSADMTERLAIYADVPTTETEKFKALTSSSYFEWMDGGPFVANCHNDVSLAAQIASDVLQHFFDVPHGATLYYYNDR